MRLVREFTVRKHQVRREVVFSCIKKLHAAPRGEYAHSSTNPESSAHPTRGGQIFELSQLFSCSFESTAHRRGVFALNGKREIELSHRAAIGSIFTIKPHVQHAIKHHGVAHCEFHGVSGRGRIA